MTGWAEGVTTLCSAITFVHSAAYSRATISCGAVWARIFCWEVHATTIWTVDRGATETTAARVSTTAFDRRPPAARSLRSNLRRENGSYPLGNLTL